jgi:divalent metal cation (Fe/Co/Zn/Cd) transporter
LDAAGGLLLSLVVILTWSQTSAHHVRNLTGFSAQPDERNLLLYLTMRFATAIRQIQNLRAYHAGDKLFVEVDIVLSAVTPLKDSHDLSEVLTYFLESVPIVDRAFVHVDYTSYNAPTHIVKQSSQ